MTSINNVSSTGSINATAHISSGKAAHPLKQGGDSQGKEAGGLLDAIDKALKSAGISGGLSSILGKENGSASSIDNAFTDTKDSTKTANTDAASALSAFMQSLLAALQSQTNGSDSTKSASNSTKPASEGVIMGVISGSGGADIESKLQGLMSQLSKSSPSDSNSSNASDSSKTSLKSSFDSLMEALGKSSSSNEDLQAFLKSLSSSLEGKSTSGVVVSTKV